MAKKKKFERIELVLYGVLSYPDLANPKPYKGKIYYRTDVLFEVDDPQLFELKKQINAVRKKTWGADKNEWPEGARKRYIQDGNEREDQPTYKDKFFITVSTQTQVDVIDPKGRPFSAQMVKGGMFAKVAVCISPWDNDGEEGLSIYLQGVMVDTAKQKLPGFGGGKSAKQLFGLEDTDEGAEDSDAEDHEDEEEDEPKNKKKPAAKKKPVEEDDAEDEAEESDDDYSDDEEAEDDED